VGSAVGANVGAGVVAAGVVAGVGAGVGAVVGAVVGAIVVAGGEPSPMQILKPFARSEPSAAHVMSFVGVTPSGPRVPEYSTSFTVSLSKLYSVLKSCTSRGPDIRIVHSWLLG